MFNAHEDDRRFLRSLRTMTVEELLVYLRSQMCEWWRQIAIERELARRGDW
jgi:hypothetical protein